MVAARLHARWKQPRRRRLCHELTVSLCEISPPPHLATGQSLCGLRLKGTSLPGWLRTPKSAKDPFYACSVPHFLTGAAVSIRFCHGAPLAPMKPVKPIRYIPLVPLCPGLCGSVWGQRAESLDSKGVVPHAPVSPPKREERMKHHHSGPSLRRSPSPSSSHPQTGWLGVGGVPRQAYHSSSWFALQMHRRRAAAHADADADADGLYSPPLPPVTSACRAVGCRPARERHWIFLWRSTCSGILLHWSGRNSGLVLQPPAVWTGESHSDPIEIRLPLRSISHPHLRSPHHHAPDTIHNRFANVSPNQRRPWLQSLLAAPAAACLSDLLTVQRCPSWGISKYWEDYTASCSWWAIFAATARSGDIHSNQLAVQLSTTAQARLRERVEADGHGDTSDIDDLAIEAPSKYVSHTHLRRASDCSQSPLNSLHPSSR